MLKRKKMMHRLCHLGPRPPRRRRPQRAGLGGLGGLFCGRRPADLFSVFLPLQALTPPKKTPVMAVLLLLLAMNQLHQCHSLRCYVCGGHTGRACTTEIRQSVRRSPFVRPAPQPEEDASKQWEVCNDLINNKGCIKQVVNDVVILRACWMQATDKCLFDRDAIVCTCTGDLCNAAAPTGGVRSARTTTSATMMACWKALLMTIVLLPHVAMQRTLLLA